jgi:mRNA interferase MazF
MIEYQPGDIVLLEFPFSDTIGVKRRPALVLLDVGDDDILVARVTSRITHSRFDAEIVEWEQAGLLLPSVARVHKIATLEKKLVRRKLGTLTAKD